MRFPLALRLTAHRESTATSASLVCAALMALAVGPGCSTSKTASTGGSGGSTSGNGVTNAAASSATGAFSSTTGGGDVEPPELAGMTAAHNAARASVQPAATPAIPKLAWSSQVETYAKKYASMCVFKHSMGPYGENLFATSGSSTPQDVVTSWVSESADYNYTANSCSKACGHYTQVVWRDSTKLGCAVANCTINSPFGGTSWQNWVCEYDPPGNFVGQKPY